METKIERETETERINRVRNKCRKITIKLGREGEKEIEKGVEKK